MVGRDALESVDEALCGERSYREKLAKCMDAVHRVIGEAILKYDPTEGDGQAGAPVANDDEVALSPRDRKLKHDLDRRLLDLDRDLAQIENAQQHKEEGTKAILAAMDDRSAELIKKRMRYAGRGSVRAMVRIRLEHLHEERAKVQDRLIRLKNRARRDSEQKDLSPLATLERVGISTEPLEVGRKMASQVARFSGGDVVERRLGKLKLMLEESLKRTRLLDEASKRIVSQAEASSPAASRGLRRGS